MRNFLHTVDFKTCVNLPELKVYSVYVRFVMSRITEFVIR